MSAKEPFVWGAGITAVWYAVVLVIVAAAGGDDPTVDAGTVVFVLPLVTFGVALFFSFRGRPLSWATKFAVTIGVSLGFAYLVVALVRWEPGAIYLVPIIALIGGFITWVCAGGGWVLGAIVRSGLGLDEADESHDPNRL